MKILVIRFSSIGDIVLTTPVLRCIKKQFPECKLHYATKKNFSEIVSSNPYVDKVHCLDDNFGAFSEELKSEQFDYIFDLHNNLRTLRLSLKLTFKKMYRVNKANFQKWLLVRKWTTKPVKHIVHRYLEVSKRLGIEYDGQGLDFFYTAQELPVSLPHKYVVMAIGGTWSTKKMPVNQLSEIAVRCDHPVVLIGGREDVSAAEEIVKICPAVINLCGQLSLSQSAEVVKSCKQIVTHDTGMMHIAAALRKPVHVIWGNTIPEFGFSPFYPDGYTEGYQNFEVKDLNCRPCSKIGFQACPEKHFNCMRKQDMPGIIESINYKSH